jgi:thymidylate synthase (FAD)
LIEVTLIDSMGTDLSTVNAARVSFNKKSKLVKTGTVTIEDADGYVYEEPQYGLNQKDSKLVSYLAEHKHISPFGHAAASFYVKAPVFVARQLVKHKFLRWNEISRRYVDDEPEFYQPDVWRGRSEDKKQGSEGELRCPIRPEAMYKDALDHYKVMIDWGICPEQARMVLPQSMMTEWYWTGSLDAFANMCNLRCTEDTQYESRIVADRIDEEMYNLFPKTWHALREF